MGTTVTGGIDVAGIATRQEFAVALTAVREGAGLTVRQVARATGISPSTVGGYFSGRHLPPLRPDGGVRAILQACGVSDPAALDAWQATLARIRRAPGPRPGGLPSPWVGLRAHGPQDVGRFHGRDEQVEELADLVLAAPLDGGIVALVGEAGAGKSSLLGAGLVPRLRAGGQQEEGVGQEGTGRFVAVLTPGAQPLRALAAAVAPITGASPEAALAALTRSPTELRALVGGPGTVLVVDQLEQLFVHCPDEDERQAFVLALAAASRSGPRDEPAPAAVVVALRSRFLSQAARHPDLLRALRPAAHQETGAPARVAVLTPMTSVQLRSAVLGPARSGGLDVDELVLDRILTDAAKAPAPVLPRLSHGLARAWQDGQRSRLAAPGDDGTAGLAASVEEAGEAAYRALSGPAQAAARDLFRRLHVVTPGGTMPAPPLPPASTGDEDAAIVRTFVEAGLLVSDEEGVRVTSGCLPELWARLAQWLDAGAASAVTEEGADESVTGAEPGAVTGATEPGAEADATLRTAAHRADSAPTGRDGRDWWAWRWALVALLMGLTVVAGVAHEVWR